MLTCLQAIHNVCLVFFFFTFGTDLKLQNLFVERLKHIPRNIPPRAHRKDAPPDPTQRPAGDPSSTWPNSSPQTAPGEHRIWFHPSGPGPPSQPAPHQEARTASRSPSSQTQARSLGTAEHGEERRSPRRAQAMIERAALSRCSAPWEARPGEAFPSPERVEGGGNRRPGPGPHIPPRPGLTAQRWGPPPRPRLLVACSSLQRRLSCHLSSNPVPRFPLPRCSSRRRRRPLSNSRESGPVSRSLLRPLRMRRLRAHLPRERRAAAFAHAQLTRTVSGTGFRKGGDVGAASLGRSIELSSGKRAAFVMYSLPQWKEGGNHGYGKFDVKPLGIFKILYLSKDICLLYLCLCSSGRRGGLRTM